MICFVCFGDPASPMTTGYSVGIFALLVVVVCVLGGLGAFFFSMYKRSKKTAL